MPSRRVFKERILREARQQSQSGIIDLTGSLGALPVATNWSATDSLPFLTSGGNGYRGTATLLRDYVLTISGGTATIAENLTVGGTLTKTGTGTVTIAPATAGTLNNIVIGGVTPLAGTFTALTSPTLASAASLALVATGANVITGTVNSVEGLRVTGNANATSTETSLWNVTGSVMARIPLNTLPSLLNAAASLRVDQRMLALGQGTTPDLVLFRFAGTYASPSAVSVNNNLGQFAAGGADGTSPTVATNARIAAFARENFSPTNKGTKWQFYTTDVGSASVKLLFEAQGGGTNIAEIVSGQATLRIIPGATALTIRDSANTLDAVTFNAAGTLTTIATALNVPTIGTLTAINTPTTLTISGTGETLATFVDDGAVTLYHNNVARIATTATGVTVTDDITTGAPAGAAAAWRLGSLTTAAVTPDTTRYLEVSVGGVVYKVIIST